MRLQARRVLSHEEYEKRSTSITAAAAVAVDVCVIYYSRDKKMLGGIRASNPVQKN